MNRTKYAAAGIVLALACALALTGCPKEAGDPEFDSKLVDKWTNGNSVSYLEKRLEIKADGSFTADLNPAALGAAAAGQSVTAASSVYDTTSWHVTGKLIQVEGPMYKMDGLEARSTDIEPSSGKPANEVLPAFWGAQVLITLTPDGNSFVFSPAGADTLAAQIYLFFGGTYSRVAP
jgi:hypothetical protein